MANKLYEENNIKAIADAIREKNSSTDTYKVEEMAEAVKNISGGDEALWRSFMSNGADGPLTVYDFSKLDISYIRSYAFNNFQNQQVLHSIILPDNLTEIPDFCFNYCKYTTDITLPEGITSIGNYAFYQCENLTLTSLPEGITSIGNNAFYQCENLTLTSLPEGITRIGIYAFSGCTGLALTSLPEGITSIGIYAFSGCTGLALTSLPEGITSIGIYAFSGCTGLALTSLPEGITSIGNSAFSGCTGLAKMSINNPTLELSTTDIFNKCTNLKTLKLKVKSLATSKIFGSTSFDKVWISQDCAKIEARSISSHPFWNDFAFDIYCEVSTRPSKWGTYWNLYSQSASDSSTVHWGVTEEEFDALDDTTTDESEVTA